MPGLTPPSPEDILGLDPATLAALTLEELSLELERLGVGTDGLKDTEAALRRLIERTAIDL